jgi:hypothetical protein
MLFEERYKCPTCIFIMTIWRNQGEKREKGHKKKLFCPFCDIEHNFDKLPVE